MDGEWTLETVQALKTMAQNREPASAIAMRLGKDIEAVRAKLLQLGIAPAPDLRDGDASGASTPGQDQDVGDAASQDTVRLHTM